MGKLNFKKAISMILVAIMLLTAVPTGVFASQGNKPKMQVTNYNGDFHAYKADVVTITILDEIDTTAMNGTTFRWDLSANAGSGEVMAWMYKNEEASSAGVCDLSGHAVD